MNPESAREVIELSKTGYAEEIWKESILGYQVSNQGRIRRNGKIINGCIAGRGYRVISVWENKKERKKKLHRMIALAFLENPSNKEYVNHKDGNKSNNVLSNLEWCTPSENAKHAYNMGLLYKREEITVYQFSKSGELINKFNSIKEAAKSINGCPSCITKVTKGRRKLHKGFEWRVKI